jgi:hypothetical protein
MAIEQLLKRQINVVDFHPVEERPKSPRRKFEELKRTPLYDEQLGLWHYSISEEQIAHNSYHSSNQLIGIFIEGIYDNEQATKSYDSLKQTDFYNKKPDHWKLTMADDSSVIFSGDQLLGVLVEGIFDKEKAGRKYETLKQKLCSEDNGELWIHQCIRKNLTKVDHKFQSEDQLLGIMIEAMFDKKEAEKKYEHLKQSRFYDKETELWNYFIMKESEQRATPDSPEQLMGIVVEAIFDRERARKKYERFKKTEQKLGATYANDELYKIWIETLLEKPEFIEKVEPVPEVRRF